MRATRPGDSSLTVYEPIGRAGPKVRPYLRNVWANRRLAYHLARATQKARHYDTWFGQLWAVLNPLLLAGVYLLVIDVILGSSRDLIFLLAGIFVFYYTRNAVGLGAQSIIGGSSVVMQTALPRALLPIASSISALMLFAPMLGVYAIFHVGASKPIRLALLLIPLLVAIQAVFNLGLGLLFATLTVYFRDTRALLPYLLRIWLYVSPVLYTVADIPERIRPFMAINPMYPLLASWHGILFEGRFPSPGYVGAALAWACLSLVAGGWVFLSREREFAVRI